METRKDLIKATDALRFDFYERIAKLVVDNPELSLADLTLKFGVTNYAVRRAQRMFKITRKKGKAAPAYGKNSSTEPS